MSIYQPFRVPNAKRIAECFQLTDKEAKEVRKVLKEGVEREYGHVSHTVVAWLNQVDVLIPGTFGVESMGDFSCDQFDGGRLGHLWYLNAGDTYAATLIYNEETKCVSIGCWGDIAERNMDLERIG